MIRNNKNISYYIEEKPMKTIKTITISIPVEMSKEIQQLAQEEHRTVSELIRESFRQYKAQRILRAVAKKGQATTKKKGLTAKDFGGPFEE